MRTGCKETSSSMLLKCFKNAWKKLVRKLAWSPVKRYLCIKKMQWAKWSFLELSLEKNGHVLWAAIEICYWLNNAGLLWKKTSYWDSIEEYHRSDVAKNFKHSEQITFPSPSIHKDKYTQVYTCKHVDMCMCTHVNRYILI